MLTFVEWMHRFYPSAELKLTERTLVPYWKWEFSNEPFTDEQMQDFKDEYREWFIKSEYYSREL